MSDEYRIKSKYPWLLPAFDQLPTLTIALMPNGRASNLLLNGIPISVSGLTLEQSAEEQFRLQVSLRLRPPHLRGTRSITEGKPPQWIITGYLQPSALPCPPLPGPTSAYWIVLHGDLIIERILQDVKERDLWENPNELETTDGL